MFLGSFEHSLDNKGRIVLPSEFRRVLQEESISVFKITKWYDGCLCLFPEKEWKNVEEKLNSLPKTNPDARYVTRLIFGNAREVEIDKQGRIFIPLSLRKATFIKRNVIIIGQGNSIEIWAKEKWNEYNKKINKTLEEVAKELGV
jgi:MraZ protein